MLNKIIVISLALGLLNSCSWFSKPQMNSAGQVVAGSEVTIKAQENTLTFEPQVILAQPGQKIKLKISNQMQRGPLNFLLLQQGDDPVVVSQLVLQTSSADDHWMPSEDYYLAYTGPIASQKSAKLHLKMPTEQGIYYFVSTYPGTPAILRGKFIVATNTSENENNDSTTDPNYATKTKDTNDTIHQ